VILAGEAALRVGAGRLGVAVPASVDRQLGVAMPEAAVFALPPRAGDTIDGILRDELRSADAVLVGPGFDDADKTERTLSAVADVGVGVLVLDAFAIGVLPRVSRSKLPSALILNVNLEEAAILRGRELKPDPGEDVRDIAQEFDAIVHCYGTVATPDGELWRIDGGGPGLGTSGSGDVLAGAITGFAARGVEPARAAVWGSWSHARAGDRLTGRAGIGFLARDILPELSVAVSSVL
jgi:NAD(P)H-hydrate repair Nnr-like enzyme with NAD(P)H-hydrate dehydratase domain